MRASELVEKGVAEYTRGLPEEAERLWREALAADPGCERARTYLEQLRAPPRSGLRPPGGGAAPVPASELADAAPPKVESSPASTSPARGPVRFSLSPERLAAAHRSSSRSFARRALLLVGMATAVVVAIAWGLMAALAAGDASPVSAVRRAAASASATLAALPGEALRLVKPLAGTRGPEPAVPGATAKPIASAPPQQRGGGSDGGKAPGRLRRSTEPAGPAPTASPADGTLRRASLGTRWGMTLGELLTALPSASRISHADRSELWPLVVEARAERVDVGGHAYRAEFLFDHLGRLGAIRLESILRTTGDAVYDGLRASLAAELGDPSAAQAGLASLGRWAARSSWETSQARVDLEVRRPGLNQAPVLLVDIRSGNLMPIADSTIVLTLVAPDAKAGHAEQDDSDRLTP